MTSVADTRLLLAHRFPPSREAARSIYRLVEMELIHKILIPSVVVTEYLKIAGARIGLEAALTHITAMEARGAETVSIDRETALQAGGLLLVASRASIAHSLIATVFKVRKAAYVLTDDPHFEELGVKTRWIPP